METGNNEKATLDAAAVAEMEKLMDERYGRMVEKLVADQSKILDQQSEILRKLQGLPSGNKEKDQSKSASSNDKISVSEQSKILDQQTEVLQKLKSIPTGVSGNTEQEQEEEQSQSSSSNHQQQSDAAAPPPDPQQEEEPVIHVPRPELKEDTVLITAKDHYDFWKRKWKPLEVEYGRAWRVDGGGPGTSGARCSWWGKRCPMYAVMEHYVTTMESEEEAMAEAQKVFDALPAADRECNGRAKAHPLFNAFKKKFKELGLTKADRARLLGTAIGNDKQKAREKAAGIKRKRKFVEPRNSQSTARQPISFGVGQGQQPMQGNRNQNFRDPMNFPPRPAFIHTFISPFPVHPGLQVPFPMVPPAPIQGMPVVPIPQPRQNNAPAPKRTPKRRKKTNNAI
jgi:hypothetical protein